MHVAQCIQNCLALERIRYKRSSDLDSNVKRFLADSSILPAQQNLILSALEEIPIDLKFSWLQYLFSLILTRFANKHSGSDLSSLLALAFEKRTNKLELHNLQIALILFGSRECLSSKEMTAAKPLTYAPINGQIIPLGCIKKLVPILNYCGFVLAGIDDALQSNSYFTMNHCLNYARLIIYGVRLEYFGDYLNHVYAMIEHHLPHTQKHTAEHRILLDAILSVQETINLIYTPDANTESDSEENDLLYDESTSQPETPKRRNSI